MVAPLLWRGREAPLKTIPVRAWRLSQTPSPQCLSGRLPSTLGGGRLGQEEAVVAAAPGDFVLPWGEVAHGARRQVGPFSVSLRGILPVVIGLIWSPHRLPALEWLEGRKWLFNSKVLCPTPLLSPPRPWVWKSPPKEASGDGCQLLQLNGALEGGTG